MFRQFLTALLEANDLRHCHQSDTYKLMRLVVYQESTGLLPISHIKPPRRAHSGITASHPGDTLFSSHSSHCTLYKKGNPHKLLLFKVLPLLYFLMISSEKHWRYFVLLLIPRNDFWTRVDCGGRHSPFFY